VGSIFFFCQLVTAFIVSWFKDRALKYKIFVVRNILDSFGHRLFQSLF